MQVRPERRDETLAAHDRQVVYIVDDNAAVRESIQRLLVSVQLDARSFESAEAFLAALNEDASGCLLLDVRMPGMGGLELQRALIARGVRLPVIFLTGYGDVPMAVQAMQDGAADFIEKPFNPQRLLDLVHACLRQNRVSQTRRHSREAALDQLEKLTKRERDIAEYIVSGKPSKVIAAMFDISEKTVDVHRHNILKKARVRSVAELVQVWMQAHGKASAG
jgi:two-component system, LuxR family, response regulator FixJ